MYHDRQQAKKERKPNETQTALNRYMSIFAIPLLLLFNHPP